MVNLRAFFCVVLMGFAGIGVQAQDLSPIDSNAIVTGTFNISVVLGKNMGRVSGDNALTAPITTVGNIFVGYQYLVGSKWAVNTSLGLGYQPFKFGLAGDTKREYFNKTVFMMPYFALSMEMKRRLKHDIFLGVSANIHVNTLSKYTAEYSDIKTSFSNVGYLYLERDLTEYAGVQHGIGISFGKSITKGSWSGFDISLNALILNRQKLVINYWDHHPAQEERPTGKIYYNGAYLGLGICYNFND
ncbi:hypothetical protein GC194_14415 [bacterium]|nr:hypothetical protein [bacterium]